MIQLHPTRPRQSGDRRGAHARPPTVHVLADFASQSAQMLADAIGATVRRTGRCRIALAGGPAAQATYGQLRELLPDAVYANLRVTWTDEPVSAKVGHSPGDWQPFAEESHLRMSYLLWLSQVPLAAENVLPLSLSDDPRAELLRFGRAFQRQFDGGVDIALVALGADGSLGALQPDHPGLDVDDLALAIHDAPEPPHTRIALALPVLQRASTVIVLATGKSRADAVAAAVRSEEGVPASRLNRAAQVYYLADLPAARGVLDDTYAGMSGK